MRSTTPRVYSLTPLTGLGRTAPDGHTKTRLKRLRGGCAAALCSNQEAYLIQYYSCHRAKCVSSSSRVFKNAALPMLRFESTCRVDNGGQFNQAPNGVYLQLSPRGMIYGTKITRAKFTRPPNGYLPSTLATRNNLWHAGRGNSTRNTCYSDGPSPFARCGSRSSA